MQSDLGKLLLRLTTGGLMLFYGLYKLQNGIQVVKDIVRGQGLPEVIANAVYLGEVVAPVLVVLGIFTRAAAGVMAIDMLAAIFLAGMANILKTGAYGAYALEIEAFFLLNALAIMLLGPGKLALGGRRYG
jgi:putative oxidoreductase